MVKQGLQVDYEYYQKNESSFEDLKEASNRLTVATQEQFDEIKNEKWFKRVFDIVTFSKKNEKRMAVQISNLAQAQQILMEILVRLSARDKSISNLVAESFEKIEKLSANDILLAKRIRQLENSCILGISKQTDISNLSEVQRIILGGLLYNLMQQFEIVSDAQRKYANRILNYLGVEANQIDVKKALDSIINIDIKKEIFICCLEYGFLNEFTFDYLDDFEEMIAEFDFGNKTIKEMKTRISATYNLRGIDGFIDKYGQDDVELDEEFFVELEEMDVEAPEIEMKELHLTGMVHIEKGESKHFVNTILHIGSYLNCNGNLIFENCMIYYNESDAADEITLSEGATLKFINCQIVCMGIDETPFIQGEWKNEVILENCELINCSYFIKTGSESAVFLDYCKIENPCVDFLDGNFENGTISNCYIHFSKIPEQNAKLLEKSSSFSDPIFNNSSYNDGVDNLIMFKECVIEGDQDFNKQQHDIKVFDIYRAFYENCTFKNINLCISKSEKISKCQFIHCDNVIDLDGVFDHPKNILNCLFEKCQNVVKAVKSNIANCQFVECKNRVIEAGYAGDVNLEFCEFLNLTFDLEKETWRDDACLYFHRTKGKDSYASTVKKCTFNGVNVNDGFLIMGNIFEKVNGPTAYIEECYFQNCVTKRESGKIIKEYGHYYGLFDKKIEVQAVSIHNCKGLDKINKENGYSKDVIIKSETSAGLKIGATIVAASIVGVPGLFAGKIIDMSFKDSDIHVE